MVHLPAFLMRYKIPPVLILVLAAAWLARLALEASWAHFAEFCPNTDVLSWDANLRMLTVLDQYQDFRDGSWFSALWPLIDAPTWPPLRNVISLIVFWLHPTGPNTLIDVSISFVFYVLVFPSILLIAFEISRDWLRAAVIFFFATVLLIQSRQLPVFGVSAMLETQGSSADLDSSIHLATKKFLCVLLSLPSRTRLNCPC